MTAPQTVKEPRDIRLRKQLFPNSEDKVFETTEKGFAPIPIVYRKLLKHLTPPQSRVLLYLQLRASRYGICHPTIDEIAHDLGLSSAKKLTPHLRALEQRRFIASRTSGGKRYFLLHHPRIPVMHMLSSKTITDAELFEINELLSDLKQDEITHPISPATGSMGAK